MKMANTYPGGCYEGPKGVFHDAEGKPISREEADKRLAELYSIKHPGQSKLTPPEPAPELSVFDKLCQEYNVAPEAVTAKLGKKKQTEQNILAAIAQVQAEQATDAPEA